jgi:CHAT domain-containing protein
MTAPEPNLKVEKISVICADTYELETNKRPLPEAKAEKEWLSATFGAVPVQGNYPPVIDWIKSLPIGPGHLAHFALHGYSNPIANEQVLVLGDGRNVNPGVLSGLRLINKEPRYGMVFLNACQVGTAGVTLGQFAGFPGSLLAAGTNAVIGPIWEVNDAAAHQLVMSFYENTFNQRVPVSEALRRLRESCDPEATTTPLAYIFYGHPDLMLQR